MKLTYYKKEGDRRESADTGKFCKTNGIVPLYEFDEFRGRVKRSGSSEMNYDFVIQSEEREFDFPEGTEKGYIVIYRWSTNPFSRIVKSRDVTVS